MKYIEQAWEDTIKDIDVNTNEILEEIKSYIRKGLTEEQIYQIITDEYQKNIKEILKITPGLSTGLYDINDDIKINTYDGKISDVEDIDINNNTVFDASSMTKLFTVLLLLKEEEKGNIDLDKKYSDYSKQLKDINIPIIDSLRFMVEYRTDGRIDEKNITKEEIERRFNKTYVYEKHKYKYSDIPYMLIPLLFGGSKEESTENYLSIFYETFRKINLNQTGYTTINMTGGRIVENRKKEKVIFDPKANIFEKKLGYISGHAGVTTNTEDLEKLFVALKKGFLKKSTLERLIEDCGNRRATGVFINKKDISESPVPKELSTKAFAISGSTGTYAVFDLESGLMTSILSNIKSTTKNRIINTGNIYTFGDSSVEIPSNFETTVIGGTGTIRDGRIINKDKTEITFFRATNNFKEIQINTLIKLKLLKNYIKLKNNKVLTLRK